MSFLITGGASQVGSALARQLKEAGQRVIIASRSGRVPEGFDSVKLDWLDASTLSNPFSSGEPIHGVYILLPPGYVDPSQNIKAFIDKAVEHGVKRFVLLSGSAVDKDADFGISNVWRYLEEKGLDYFALRPTWFIDNIYEFYGKSIREADEFKTVMPNAKIPFVSVEDIAKFAVGIFLSEKNTINEQRIVGPELLSFDQIAAILTDVLGRKITHKPISPEELTQEYVSSLGWPEDYAKFLVEAELGCDAGSQEQWWGKPENAIGKETTKEWAQRFKAKLT
ncbi:NmrA family protein [Ephemerocybe angulata]|uniref:NmrA family protein n=1 Tax=Ephemerocybe angulata TaxID=980116 RepID=A0A8H6M3U7_9AGAR|nr:NmrA family protein [Tulosesus angulatus]